MERARRIVHGALVVACYVLWAGVAIGLAGSAGLWVLSRAFGDGTDTSSAYELISENAQWLLVGSAVLGVGAISLSWWVDRHVE